MKCEEAGAHDFQSTTSVGWFQCGRAIGSTPTSKKTGRSKLIYCQAVAHCPGCLGYSLSDCPVVFCSAHYQICRLEDFPVYTSAHVTTQNVISAEQHTLF